MKKRPTSITVIAWIIIVTGAISLIATTAMIKNPMGQDMMARSPWPVHVQYAISYVGLLILFACGVSMLKGCNWARYLYVIWSLIGFAIGIATAPMKVALIPVFVVFLIAVFFLFRAKANAYFTPVEVQKV